MAKWVAKTADDYRAALQQIQAKANKTVKSMLGASKAEFVRVCMNILADAVMKAPVKDGFLRGSAYMLINGDRAATGREDGGIDIGISPEAVEDMDDIHVTIGFDSHIAPYAFIQHEHIEFHHPMGGEAKFLESSVDYWSSQLVARMKAAMEGVSA